MSKLDNLENWQKASVVTSLLLTVVLIVNTSLMAYINYQDTFTASMASSPGESLDIQLQGTIGRPSPLSYYLNPVLDYFAGWMVNGVSKNNAETGIVVSISGSNVGASASVDYYIEAKESTGAGQPFRFLEGNGTSVTVNGADLNLSNQTSITEHLAAMGLTSNQDYTIKYYVYVKAETIGAISGETLTSEISYQLFDSVTYTYGSISGDRFDVDSGDDNDGATAYYREDGSDYFAENSAYNYLGDNSDTMYDYGGLQVFYTGNNLDGVTVTSAYLEFKAHGDRGTPYPTIKIDAMANTNRDLYDSWSDYDNTRTGNSTTWQPSSWTADTWINSTDISDIVQELISGSYGGYITVCTHDNDQGWGDDRNYLDYYATNNDAPNLYVFYLDYSASWYPIGTVSVLDMPLGQTLGTLAVIALSCYAVYSALIQTGEKKK